VQKIKKAGFQEVQVIDETFFPIELIAMDPTAKEIIAVAVSAVNGCDY